MWNLPPPPGFQGLHPDKPVVVYQRHLPHWQTGALWQEELYDRIIRDEEHLWRAPVHRFQSGQGRSPL